MTHPNLLTILVILFSLLLLLNSFAEDYTRWHLPEGAIARFGKGSIRELADIYQNYHGGSNNQEIVGIAR